MLQPLQKTVWSFLKKLKTELPYAPAIPLQVIYLEKTKGTNSKIYMQQDFAGGPVVKTPHFQRRGHRFNPWSEN